MPPQNVTLDRKSCVGGRNDAICSVRVVGGVDVVGDDIDGVEVEKKCRWVASSFGETDEARHDEDQRR